MRKLYIGGLVVLAVLVGLWFYKTDKTEPVKAVQSNVPVNQQVKSNASSVSAFATSGRTVPTPVPGPAAVARFAKSPLAQGYESADELTAFIDEAIKHPEQGGFYFANLAHMECARFSNEAVRKSQRNEFIKLFNQDDPTLAERLGIYDSKLLGRCKNFDSFRDAKKYQEIIKLAKDSNDPLWQAKKELWDMKPSVEERAANLQKALSSTTDPYLFKEATQIMGNAAQTGALLIDGQPIPLQDAKAAWAASQLLPCQFGTDCSAGSPMTQPMCELTRCDQTDYFQLYQRYVSPPDEFQRVMEYYNKFASILSKNEVSRITLQKSPYLKTQ